MRTLIAKFPGTCSGCGKRFRPGTEIRFGGRGITYHLTCDSSSADPEARRPADRVSDHIQIGGRNFYRNTRGRCEDAPCCGCCTI